LQHGNVRRIWMISLGWKAETHGQNGIWFVGANSNKFVKDAYRAWKREREGIKINAGTYQAENEGQEQAESDPANARAHAAQWSLLRQWVRSAVMWLEAGAMNVEKNVAENKGQAGGDKENWKSVLLIDEYVNEHTVVYWNWRLRTGGQRYAKGAHHHRHDERIQVGPLAKRVDEHDYALALWQGQACWGNDHAEQHDNDLQVRPYAGKNGDENWQRVVARCPHVFDGILQRKVKQRRKNTQAFVALIVIRSDYRLHAASCAHIRRNEKSNVEKKYAEGNSAP
jgi:hypothetical protein